MQGPCFVKAKQQTFSHPTTLSNITMAIQPIKLWGHAAGPNPWKVAIVLEELNIPYEHKFLDFASLKKDPYERLNPNGRVPTIEDPNTNLTIFESGAIIDYLLEKYDTTKVLTPSNEKVKWLARSWRDIQMSGQGPYFGQAVWFIKFHPENVQSAVDRYKNEVRRIVSVIDRYLARESVPYLAGNEITYADLMWATWNAYLPQLLPEGVGLSEFPHFDAWWSKVSGRESVRKMAEAKKTAMAAEAH